MNRLTFSLMRLLVFISLLFSIPSFASTVLVVGDSHTTGPFGKKLDELIRAEHTVMTRGACGTVGQNWQLATSGGCGEWNWGKDINGKIITSRSTPKLSQLVDTIKPDYVILQFGGNYRAWLEEKSSSIPLDVAALIKTAKSQGAKCLFVTGPDTFKMRDLLPDTIEKIKDGIGNECEFFNSLEVTTYPDQAYFEKRADGRHYSFLPEGEPIAHLWAQKVFQSLIELEQANPLSSTKVELHSQE